MSVSPSKCPKRFQVRFQRHFLHEEGFRTWGGSQTWPWPFSFRRKTPEIIQFKVSFNKVPDHNKILWTGGRTFSSNLVLIISVQAWPCPFWLGLTLECLTKVRQFNFLDWKRSWKYYIQMHKPNKRGKWFK